MEHSLMKKYVETTFGFEYNPFHIVPLFEKNTLNKKYFLWRPFDSGFLQQEFLFDVNSQRFTQMDYTDTQVDWDPVCYDDVYA